jgi:hypothetical protein
MGSRLSAKVERWMPSPFIFAIFLTYIVFLAGVLVEGTGPIQMVQYWFDGFWVLLSFLSIANAPNSCPAVRRNHINHEYTRRTPKISRHWGGERHAIPPHEAAARQIVFAGTTKVDAVVSAHS